MYRRKPHEIPQWERETNRRLASRRLAKLQAEQDQHFYPNKGVAQLAEEIFQRMEAQGGAQ
jgi:hypothetical protein